MRSSSTVADRRALEEQGSRHAADLGEQVEVLHVARADLDHVRDLGDLRDVARVSSSVTIGSPVSSRASARISSPFAPSPWNAYGEVRGLNAPPRSIVAPGRGDGSRGLERLLARLDGARARDEAEEAVADPAAADLDDGRIGRELARDERIREKLGRPVISIGGESMSDATPLDRSRENPAMRIFSGIQPTGAKHIGNYAAASASTRRRRSRATRSSASSTCTRSASTTTPRTCASERSTSRHAHRHGPRPRALDDLRAEPRHRPRRGELAARRP